MVSWLSILDSMKIDKKWTSTVVDNLCLSVGKTLDFSKILSNYSITF